MFARVINDPLYGSIQLTGGACDIVDTKPFQRLRRIRQLGYAYLVYPSATHSRFEHPIGAYHLATVVTDRMRARGELTPDLEEHVQLARLAALVHDVGHFGSAHLLEELELEEADHEVVGERWITDGPIAEVLARTGIPDAAERIAAMIRHESDSPLASLVAGAVDVDRLDYMRRDAYYCGLPVAFQQDRLINALTLQPHPETGRLTLMLHEKAIGSLDQMIWQRYVLYRSVYRHRVVRSASVMARSMILLAVESGIATLREIQSWHDDQLLAELKSRAKRHRHVAARQIVDLVDRLQYRRLYRVAAQAPIGSAPNLRSRELRIAETRIAEMLRLEPGEALLDIPHKPGMFEPDIYFLMKDGRVLHRSQLTEDEGFIMNTAVSALYRGAGRISLYTAEPRKLDPSALIETITAVAEEARLSSEVQP